VGRRGDRERQISIAEGAKWMRQSNKIQGRGRGGKCIYAYQDSGDDDDGDGGDTTGVAHTT
jgi:hypothetical protein